MNPAHSAAFWKVRSRAGVLPAAVGTLTLAVFTTVVLTGCHIVTTTGVLPGTTSIAGRVLAPAAAARSKSGSRAIDSSVNVPVGSGVTVQLGTVDANGDLPLAASSILATTITNTDGSYALTLPAGVSPSPTLVLQVAGTNPPLYSIVTGNLDDISPATTAATEQLFAQARASSVTIYEFGLLDVQSFFTLALSAASEAPVETSLSTAVSDALTLIQGSAQAIASQNVAIQDAKNPNSGGVLGQAQAMANLYFITGGQGFGANLTDAAITGVAVPDSTGTTVTLPITANGLTYQGTSSFQQSGSGSSATFNSHGQYTVTGVYTPPQGADPADSGATVNLAVKAAVSGSVGAITVTGSITYPGRGAYTVAVTRTFTVSGPLQNEHDVTLITQNGAQVASSDQMYSFNSITGTENDTGTQTLRDPSALGTTVTAQTSVSSSGGTLLSNTLTLSNSTTTKITLVGAADGSFTGPILSGSATVGTLTFQNGLVSVSAV